MYYFCLFFLLSVFSFFNYCGMIDWNFARIHRRTRSTSFRVVCAQRERRAHELQAMELIIVERSVTGGLCSSQKARFQAISPICSTERPCLSCLAWTCRPGGVCFILFHFFHVNVHFHMWECVILFSPPLPVAVSLFVSSISIVTISVFSPIPSSPVPLSHLPAAISLSQKPLAFQTFRFIFFSRMAFFSYCSLFSFFYYYNYYYCKVYLEEKKNLCV